MSNDVIDIKHLEQLPTLQETAPRVSSQLQRCLSSNELDALRRRFQLHIRDGFWDHPALKRKTKGQARLTRFFSILLDYCGCEDLASFEACFELAESSPGPNGLSGLAAAALEQNPINPAAAAELLDTARHLHLIESSELREEFVRFLSEVLPRQHSWTPSQRVRELLEHWLQRHGDSHLGSKAARSR